MSSFGFLLFAFNSVTAVFSAVDGENKTTAGTFFAAIESGNHQLVLDTLNSGVDVNLRSDNGQAALHIAAGRGDKELVGILINASAKVNAMDNHGRSPIHYAAFEGHHDVIDLLAFNSADVNKKTPEGWTPLFVSALRGHDKVVERLLLNEADDSIASSDGKTVLNIATKHGHSKVIEVLKRLVSPAQKACDLYRKLYTVPKREFGDLGKVLTARYEFPWMAALGYRKNNTNEIQFDCGGTIITENFILTAAHCITTSRSPVIVRVAQTSLRQNVSDPAYDHEIQTFIRHENYSFLSKKNDIALVRLKTSISFIKGQLYPACLRTNIDDVESNINLLVTGWGTISSEVFIRPEDLLKVQLKPMPLSECDTVFRKFNEIANLPAFRNGIDQSQYCAYDPQGKNDSCQGDSGGPLQRFIPFEDIGEVVGIVSFGVSCGSALPGVYTRVAFYLKWIESFVWPDTDDPPTFTN